MAAFRQRRGRGPELIPVLEIREKAHEWGLREDVVEKDYVLGWLLWGISSYEAVAGGWVFKGGTCLRKCYLGGYRFSQDLDFSVRPGGIRDLDDIDAAFRGIAVRVNAETGIELPVDRIRFEEYRNPQGMAMEGRIAYRGPRRPSGDLPGLEINVTLNELLVEGSEARPILHPYSDAPHPAAIISCYSLREVLAEKLRALVDRAAPRDLYDVVNIARLEELGDLRALAPMVAAKCRHKGIPFPSLSEFEQSRRRPELEAEWRNMLGHQVRDLSAIDDFLGQLPDIFRRLGPMPSD